MPPAGSAEFPRLTLDSHPLFGADRGALCPPTPPVRPTGSIRDPAVLPRFPKQEAVPANYCPPRVEPRIRDHVAAGYTSSWRKSARCGNENGFLELNRGGLRIRPDSYVVQKTRKKGLGVGSSVALGASLPLGLKRGGEGWGSDPIIVPRAPRFKSAGPTEGRGSPH